METQTIEFHYLKSPDYKTFHVDGAIGGPTPDRGLFISFYLERPTIPQTIRFSLRNDGALDPVEVSRTGKTGLIREVDCGVVMSLEAAKHLNTWLTGQIAQLESTLKK